MKSGSSRQSNRGSIRQEGEKRGCNRQCNNKSDRPKFVNQKPNQNLLMRGTQSTHTRTHTQRLMRTCADDVDEDDAFVALRSLFVLF